MDRLIRRFDATVDNDLVISRAGVAYQRDMSIRVPYDGAYLANYDAYAESPIADALNAARVGLLARHAPPGASVLDIGAASGTFVRAAIRAGFEARGRDVIPEANDRLREAELYGENPGDFDAITMWDSIEHVDAPEVYLKKVRKGAVLIAAIPVFDDLTKVRRSKHYKPGEHFYYWTPKGFVAWMGHHGFRLLEQSDHETRLGRDSIGAFAFKRDLPDYMDHIDAYRQIHESKHYGNSATELYLDIAAKVVAKSYAESIIDFGCGRSDLVAHFWKDGKRRIARYDPAIQKLKNMPEGTFDLAFCCDVMEHIPLASVDRVLKEVRAKAPRAFFAISTKLAKAKLPDGRNSHVTLLTRDEWKRWVGDYFGPIEEIPTSNAHELVLVAGKRKGN